MRESVIAAMKQLADVWEKDVGNRRARSRIDPVADAMESCASELRTELARIDDATRLQTPEEYAKEHRCTASTVRRWCANGELEAEKNGAGDWMIPRTARRRLKAG
jgi:hypothetical protein